MAGGIGGGRGRIRGNRVRGKMVAALQPRGCLLGDRRGLLGGGHREAVERGGSLNSHEGDPCGVLYIAPFGSCQPALLARNQRETGRWRFTPPLRSMCSAVLPGATWLMLAYSRSATATNACAISECGAACTTGMPLSPAARTAGS